MNSKRTYTVIIVEGANLIAEKGHDVHMFSDPGKTAWEWQYSANEILDTILDLKPGESVYFQPTRDQKDTKGIIIRTA